MARIVTTATALTLLAAPAAFAHTAAFPHAHDTASLLPAVAGWTLIVAVGGILFRTLRRQPQA